MPVLQAPIKTLTPAVAVAPSTGGQRRLEIYGKALLVALFLACVTLAAVTTLNHEPWRDEADVWLHVRDESMSGLLSRMCYIGTPALWYLCVVPLVKLGAPYYSMNLLNLAFASLAIFLLMFRSRLPFPFKAILPISCLFLYEYAVVARSYSLSVLLIFALADMHANRFKRPWIYSLLLGLLANSNVLGLCISLTILSPFAYRLLLDRKKFLPCSLAMIGLLLSTLQLIPPPNGQFNAPHSVVYAPLIALKQAFFPSILLIDHSYAFHGALFEKVILTLAAAGIVASILYLIRRSKNAIWCFVSSCVLINLVFLNYLGGYRHWGFYVVLAIYAIWISDTERRSAAIDGQKEEEHFVEEDRERAGPSARERRNNAMTWLHIPLFISICYSAFVGLNFCIEDLTRPFSAAESAAKFLLSMPDAPVAALSPFTSESMLPYMPGKRFFYPGINDYGTHMQWTREEFQEWSREKLLMRTTAFFGSSCPLYLISDHPLFPDRSSGDFRLLYDSSATKPLCHNEICYVYGRNIAALNHHRASR